MSLTLVMPSALALGPSWLDPQTMLDAFGAWALWGAAAVIFAECGLLLGFFLPGDSLLFTMGLLIGAGTVHQPLWLAGTVLTVAAFTGNVVGYEIGRSTGPRIFSRPNSRLFKQKYVDKTVAFFEQHGSRAIVLARFVPIVRTFITVTAGVGRMDRRQYFAYSGIGAVLWAFGVTVLGRLLGQFTFVAHNIEVILLLIVAVSVVPIGIEWLRQRLSRRRSGAAAATAPSAAGAQEDASQHGTGPGRVNLGGTDLGGGYGSSDGSPRGTGTPAPERSGH
ncbi:MAG: VTT domain-containing protein [Kineosporiaceae bacterium]